MRLLLSSAALALLLAAPATGKDSLGVFGQWGAFRDEQVPRCYAIAAAEPSSRRRDFQPYASVGTWPVRKVRGQVYFRLSREAARGARISLTVGRQSFVLTGNGANGWAADGGDNARILAAMRSASAMRVSARDASGNRFTDSYPLDGAATALDASLLGCARQVRR